MNLPDTLTLLTEALTETRALLEIYAKPADSTAWAAIQKSQRALKALQELRDKDLILMPRTADKVMRNSLLLCTPEAANLVCGFYITMVKAKEAEGNI